MKYSTSSIKERVTFRLADKDDAYEVARLLGAYMQETDWKRYVEFNISQAVHYVFTNIVSGNSPYLLAFERDGGAIIGIASWHIARNFSFRPIAIMDELWVRTDYRRSALGRMLVFLMVDLMAKENSCVIHAPVASGLAEARTLKNLFKKMGFHEFGYIMRKGFSHE